MSVKKKVVVLGALGMAGHILVEKLNAAGCYDVFGVARSVGPNVETVLDVTDFIALEGYIKSIKPDYVVNCIGVLVSASVSDISRAILINSYLPNFLSKIGSKNHFKLIHISTDCVFSGKEGSYKEDSFRDGDDNYSRSKSLGEIVNNSDLTIRTSIIGPELKEDGTGLFHWYMLQKDKGINGYSNAYWSGVTTLELAKGIIWAIENDVTGLYHLTNNEKISKYELLSLFEKELNRGVKINAVGHKVVNKSLIDTRGELNYRIPLYTEMVSEMTSFIRRFSTLYPFYDL